MVAVSQIVDSFSRQFLAIALLSYGEQQHTYFLQCWAGMQEVSLSDQIPALDLRLVRTWAYLADMTTNLLSLGLSGLP
jgi:hypothetical protein